MNEGNAIDLEKHDEIELKTTENKLNQAMVSTSKNLYTDQVDIAFKKADESPDRGFIADTPPVDKSKKQSFSDITNVRKDDCSLDLSAEKDLIKELEGGLQERPSFNGFQSKNNISLGFNESIIQKKDPSPVEGAPKKDNAILIQGSMSLSSEEFNGIIYTRKKGGCFLCDNPGKDQQVESTAAVDRISTKTHKPEATNSDDELIHPCLCDFTTHRGCLKAYVIASRKIGCDKCKVLYAVGCLEKRARFCARTKGFICLLSFFLALIAILAAMVAGIVVLSDGAGLSIDGQTRLFWFIVVIVVGSILSIILIFVLAKVWKSSFRKQIIDLQLYCKQTEMSKHSQDPDGILKRFLEQELRGKHSQLIEEALLKYKKLNVQRFNDAMRTMADFHENQEMQDFKLLMNESLAVGKPIQVNTQEKTDVKEDANTAEVAENPIVNKVIINEKVSAQMSKFSGMIPVYKESTSRKKTKNKSLGSQTALKYVMSAASNDNQEYRGTLSDRFKTDYPKFKIETVKPEMKHLVKKSYDFRYYKGKVERAHSSELLDEEIAEN